MGNLLDVLRSDGKKPSPNVFLDFERKSCDSMTMEKFGRR